MSKSRVLFVALFALLVASACYLLLFTSQQLLGLILIALTTSVSMRDLLEKIGLKKWSMTSVILSAGWGAFSFVLLKSIINDSWTPYFLMALGGLTATCGLVIIICLGYKRYESRHQKT